MFPLSIDPPIMTIFLILFLISGKVIKRRAKFVSDPMFTQMTGVSCFIILLYIDRKLLPSGAFLDDFLT